jgi:SNF2 family DNA or RNA helicase
VHAADRAHRIGQTRPVNVYRLVSTDTVEERVLALQERKRGLAEAVVGAGDPSAVTRAELLALLD